MFSIEFSILTISLLSASAFLVLVLLILLLRPLRRVIKAVKQDTETALDMAELPREDIINIPFPNVSVIVHSQSDASSLAILLPQILDQDYPSQFEVIVVNDGGDEDVSDVVGRFELKYSNLYMTFAPAYSRNLSRKKLAITLGIKAARYDTVIVTSGNCSVNSPAWLQLMMRHIANGKDIVTGYGFDVSSPDATPKRRRFVSFDTVRTAVQYLSSALKGRLYRAYGNNVAYRRRLFFDNKGFSGSLNLRYGDDDIFISAISNRKNFAVELSPESMVAVVEDDISQAHRLDKLRHDFTAKYVSGRTRRYFGFCSLLWWLWTIVSGAAVIAGVPSVIPACAVFVLMWILFLPLMTVWRRCSVSLCGRPLFLTVPIFMWIHPFYTLVYKIKGRKTRSKNFTWG